MSTITVPRPDVPTEEIAEALQQGLGPKYKVLPGKGVNWNPVGNPRPDHPDTIVIGTGSTRLFRAQVRIDRDRDRDGTTLHVSPGGVGPVPRLVNTLWIVRKVREVLRGAPSLQ
jgi:hypothetical protein